MWGESKLKNITLFELFENRKKTIVHIFYICKIQENTKYKKKCMEMAMPTSGN